MSEYEIQNDNTLINYNDLRNSEYCFDFREGAKVEDNTISRWIKDAIEYLKDAEAGKHYAVGSGNTVVHATKYCYGDNPKDGEYIEIDVCKGYEQIEIPLDKLIKK